MAITLKNIQELVEENAQSTSPIIFGDGTTLKRTTIQEIINNFVNQGISSLNVNNTSSQYTFFETNGQIAVPPVYNVAISTDANELRFYTVNIVNTDSGVASLRNYLFEPDSSQNLLTRLNSADSVLISSQLAQITTANTVTYSVADLDEINDSTNGFDFTNTDISYFVKIGSNLYAFQGQNGTYGDGQLQIDFNDLILISGFPKELEGTQYVFVQANGTDTENATELQDAYDLAKTMSPSSINRVTVICGVGNYNFASDFVMDEEHIDLVSLDGNRSIIFNGAGTINITANDVFVKGVDVLNKNFTIGNDLNLLKVENCQGGSGSFGFYFDVEILFSVAGIASGTFTDCVGGVESFGGNGGTASGTFTNCQGGDLAFGGGGFASGTFTDCQGGDESFGGDGGTASGTFTNCVGGDESFGSFNFLIGGGIASGTFTNCQGGEESFGGSGTASGIFTNCQGGNGSFSGGGTSSGTFTNCQGGSNSFGTQGTASGTFINCTENGVIKTQTYESNEVHFRNFPPSQFGTIANPRTGNITSTNVKASKGQVQKMYHSDSVEPTYPSTFYKAGEGEYLENASQEDKINVIFIEWVSDTRQEYWIIQTAI